MTDPEPLIGSCARRNPAAISLLAALVCLGGIRAAQAAPPAAGSAPPRGEELTAGARQEIAALLAEKASRTPSERKMSSKLVFMLRRLRGKESVPGFSALSPRLAPEEDAAVAGGTVLVDIEADPAAVKTVIARLDQLDAAIVAAAKRRGTIRARLPLAAVADLAAMPEVANIRIGRLPITRQTVVAQGAIASSAKRASFRYGTSGAGVKVGVISDGVFLLQDQEMTGDLPPVVTVLPGQDGAGAEGNAMLTIVHALAPGAELYFATGATGEAAFADNIMALRAAGCDIVVDDLFYTDEAAFQDSAVAQAVAQVVASGGLYFSAAGNEGNKASGTSSTWEGDFAVGGTPAALRGDGAVLSFGAGAISNPLLSDAINGLTLQWTDPLGASQNEYDLFVLDAALSRVVDFSTNVQDGHQNPIQEISAVAVAGERVVVVKKAGAADRFLHLSAIGGMLRYGTAGCETGHATIPGAFAVAAVDVATAHGGWFTGGAANPIEPFVCDGPRRMFFQPDGTPITPGNYSSTGGLVRRKPDLASADGVATAVPGFNPFLGTSAAAPHAAAIAALAKSILPAFTPGDFASAVAATALDIMAPGFDRDSGYGILMAMPALAALGAHPVALLQLGPVDTRVQGGASFIAPGDSVALRIRLNNVGSVAASAPTAVLSTTTPGVTVVADTSSYPDLARGEGGFNSAAFLLSLAPDAPCGLALDATLTVTYEGGNAPQQSFPLRLFTGNPAPAVTFSYAGPAVAIPDATGIEVPGVPANVPLTVSGLAGTIFSVDFRIDGSRCTTAAGATTVGVDHPFVSDLIFTLISPLGTKVVVIDEADLEGHNFCQTLLADDSPGPSISTVTAPDAPFTGSYKPQDPLAAFRAEDGNGTWTLQVTDNYPGDTGHVRAFSLLISPNSCAGASGKGAGGRIVPGGAG